MKYLYALCIALSFCFCTDRRLAKEVTQIINRQIVLTNDLVVVGENQDTVLNNFMKAPIKLLVWYDSLSCATCEVGKMIEWNAIIKYAASFGSWFNILFLFTPQKQDVFRVKIALRTHELDYPLFIDQNASFVKLNPQLPKNRQLHTFLLDKNNKVVMAGNPLYNPALWRLYISAIQKMIANDGVLPDN